MSNIYPVGMNMAMLFFVQIAISLLLFCTQTTISTEASSADPNYTTKSKTCSAHERSALLDLRAGLSDPGNLLSSWAEGNNCCHWNGVRCSNNITGHVIAVDLRGRCFRTSNGVVTASTGDVLGGHISSSLAGLRYLQHLDLSCNQFYNLRVPEFLGSLHKLRYLNLSVSGFTGRIPPQLGNLSHLHYLSLVSEFSGMLDTEDVTWLSRLSSLEYLEMDYVDLSTASNLFPVVNMLPSLKVLSLRACELSASHFSHPHYSNLTSLETLDISWNKLQQPIAPNWFWDLANLKELDASHNQFHGPFPYELGNMTSIVRLNLGSNNLVGMIPSNLKNLCSLEELSLENNNISGSITQLFQRLPSCSRDKPKTLFPPYSNATSRSLHPTKLSEPLSNLTLLQHGHTELTGAVPPWIGEFTNLKVLDLSFNSLHGVLHEDHLSGLARLKVLNLYDTSIAVIVNSSWIPPFNLEAIELRSCQLGPKFPVWLRWQTDAFNLDISNTSISGMLPDWFWEVFSSVENINMQNNQITGVLPPTMEFMRIKTLVLGSNQFSGPIPKLPINLTILDLSRNNISGPLPVNFGDLSSLEGILLFDNAISGTIPSSLCNLLSLVLLDISENQLTGPIPDCIFNASTTDLTTSDPSGPPHELNVHSLSLRNNKLSGEFPSFLQSCKALNFLDLSENQFHGPLPPWIGEKLGFLIYLRLRSNMFNGHIPMGLTKLGNLHYLDLANNSISGSIPHSIVNLKGMTQTPNSLSSNLVSFSESVDDNSVVAYNESITIVTKGQVRLYTGEIIYMVNLDLSCNNLTGKIPEEIGTLIALTSLNLSSNALSEVIPETIGALVQVESLDLSHNELSGEIPASLSALTSLSHLNLSYNNLTGKIPSGNQLQVLDDLATVYIGNPGLCGPPLSKKCPEDVLPPATLKDHQHRSDGVFLFVAVGSGFVMGLATVFYVFLFKTKWRVLCFAFYDRLYDEVYVQVAVSFALLMRSIGRS